MGRVETKGYGVWIEQSISKKEKKVMGYLRERRKLRRKAFGVMADRFRLWFDGEAVPNLAPTAF